MHICNNIHRFMRPIDIEAFQKEAASQRTYILLRKPSPEARKYIGQPGFYPKPADCKFKTADQDFFHDKYALKLTVGGLVVNPTLVEFENAFNNKKSHQIAIDIWDQHRDVISEIPSQAYNDNSIDHNLPEAKQYVTNTDTSSSFFGCVMQSQITQISHPSYIHSGYDLYAVIPTSNVKTLQGFLSELNDKPHYQGVNFTEYQVRLNRRMGAPMIQHAPQELTGKYLDDQVIVFMPDISTIYMLANQLEIRDFYRNTLGGRRLSNH